MEPAFNGCVNSHHSRCEHRHINVQMIPSRTPVFDRSQWCQHPKKPFSNCKLVEEITISRHRNSLEFQHHHPHPRHCRLPFPVKLQSRKKLQLQRLETGVAEGGDRNCSLVQSDLTRQAFAMVCIVSHSVNEIWKRWFGSETIYLILVANANSDQYFLDRKSYIQL